MSKYSFKKRLFSEIISQNVLRFSPKCHPFFSNMSLRPTVEVWMQLLGSDPGSSLTFVWSSPVLAQIITQPLPCLRVGLR